MRKLSLLILAVPLAALLLAGCASGPPAPQPLSPAAVLTEKEAARARSENNVEVKAMKSTILDWDNRNIGEKSNPEWLLPLLKGNADPFKQAFRTQVAQTEKVIPAHTTRPSRDEARIDAELNLAVDLAKSFKEKVVNKIGKTYDNNSGQMEMIETACAAVNLNVSGFKPVTTFWQLLETVDPDTNVKTREYAWYTVRSISLKAYQDLAAKYLLDVAGKLPDSRLQGEVAAAYDDVVAENNWEQTMTLEEWQQNVELRYQAAKNDQERQMALINQKTVANQGMTEVAKAQVEADAKARFAAYKYGTPAEVAVASTTASDLDSVAALRKIAAAAGL